MPSSINTNLASLTAQRSAGRSQTDLATALSRLSSGLRINGAKDDAAGLAVSDRFTAQIRGPSQAARNANDGISLAQTADGGLASVGANLQRLRELAVQSANATNSASDRASLQLEVSQLVPEIDRVARQTQFNGNNLLDGSFTSKELQVGANAGQTVSMASIADVRSSSLGVYQGFTAANLALSFPYFYVTTPQAALTVSVGGGPTISLRTIPVDTKAIAAAINNAGIAGLHASANPTVLPAGASTAYATGSGTAVLTLNGVAISIAGVNGGAALTSNRAAAVAAINAQSAASGVTAVDDGQGVSLTALDGRNIKFAFDPGTFTNSNVLDFGIDYPFDVTDATINLSYVAPAGTSGSVVFAQSYGLNRSLAIAPTGSSLAAVDISTAAGATAALGSIDAALDAVDSARAGVGAAQTGWHRRSTTCTRRAPARARRAAASKMPTSRWRPPTCRVPRCCSRPALRWSRRPTSCRSR